MIKKIKEYLSNKREKTHISRMTSTVTTNDIGLEIGPSLRPCAPKAAGYNVEIIDWLSKEQLIDKYSSMNLDVSKIEDVDYIWNSNTSSYSALTQKSNYYDYIIASHVIEHTTDFVGFLKDCENMLKENGALILAVPDKRYTLDHFRFATTTGQVLNDYANEENVGSLHSLMDYHMNACTRNGKTSWAKIRSAFLGKNYGIIHDINDNKKILNENINDRSFFDIHHYSFTPASFCLLINDLNELNLTSLGIEKKYDTKYEEFNVIMRKGIHRPLDSKERMKLIKKASKENIIT